VSFLPLVNLWDKRSLILHFSLLNIKLRFKGTYLGFIWAALEPLFIFSILYIVITSIRLTRRDDFAIYLIVGVLLYQLFARGSSGGLTSLGVNSGILKSLNIRKEFFPTVTTGATCLFLFVEIGVLFALMPVFDFTPHWTIILLPIPLILFLILVQGVSYILSILYVFVRDVQHLWQVLVYALLFLSPIFWYTSDVDGILLEIHKINPIGQIIELSHNIVVFGEIPPLTDWLYTSSIILGIFFFGYALFQKYEQKAVENL